MTSTPAASTNLRNFAADSLANRAVVVVVHSSPTVRYALFLTLDLDGFDVRVMRDADEAMLGMEDEKPEAVIVEVTAGGAAANCFVRWLRAHPATMHVPIILISRDTAGSPVREWSVCGVHHVALDGGIEFATQPDEPPSDAGVTGSVCVGDGVEHSPPATGERHRSAWPPFV